MAGPRRIVALGGAGGIGRALVTRLLAAGEEVCVIDLPASLNRHKPPCAAIPVDLHDQGSVADAAVALKALWGGMDCFVNLAGYNGLTTPLAETETAHFDDILSGNLRGAFLAAKAFLPLLDGPAPAAVNVTSGLGSYIRPNFGSYAAAKAGVIALTKTLALEYAPRVRVNAVGPGAVDTAFLRGGTGRSDETANEGMDLGPYIANIPLKRLAQPDDVVGPILFLLGPDAAYMTGQVLWINGGAYMP